MMWPLVSHCSTSSLVFFTLFSAKPDRVQSSSSSKQNRHAPSEGAQRAGAAALARIEQHQRPKVHTSQDAIRNQGEMNSNTETAAVVVAWSEIKIG